VNVVQKKKKKWVQGVKTVSTFPPEGLFTRSAETIARTLASPKVSPKGIGSGLRMLQFFINRAGKGMSQKRRRELEKAKHLLQDKAAHRAANKSGRRRTTVGSRRPGNV
jgi:tRNA(adenine34) deaminase